MILGAPARFDVEYQRNGVRDLMMICEPKRGFREAQITERRTKLEFAQSARSKRMCGSVTRRRFPSTGVSLRKTPAASWPGSIHVFQPD